MLFVRFIMSRWHGGLSFIHHSLSLASHSASTDATAAYNLGSNFTRGLFLQNSVKKDTSSVQQKNVLILTIFECIDLCTKSCLNTYKF